MVLRMKNFNVLGGSHFNVLGVHWKVRLLGGGGGSTKADIVGGYPKKRGLDSLPIKEGGGLGKKEGSGVFERELIPQCTLWSCSLKHSSNLECRQATHHKDVLGASRCNSGWRQSNVVSYGQLFPWKYLIPYYDLQHFQVVCFSGMWLFRVSSEIPVFWNFFCRKIYFWDSSRDGRKSGEAYYLHLFY